MILVVGAGLAGACAACWLAADGPVTALEAEHPAAGASGAAAGLVNPFAGARAAPTWRRGEALEALNATLERAGRPDLFRPTGLLRPAGDARQAAAFRARAEAFPDALAWLDPQTVRAHHPNVAAPWGALRVRHGGALRIDEVVRAVLDTPGVAVRTGTRVVAAGETPRGAWVELATGERLEARYVLLAPGAGYARLGVLDGLPLQPVKGQVVRVAAPPGLAPLPPLAGDGYVVPDGGTLVLGTTYEYAFADDRPTEAATALVLERAQRLVPALAGARVLEARAGIRVAVPRAVSPRRLPRVGPLPGRTRLWALVGLGSKGLLTAPLLGRALPAWLAQPAAIPPEVRLG